MAVDWRLGTGGAFAASDGGIASEGLIFGKIIGFVFFGAVSTFIVDDGGRSAATTVKFGYLCKTGYSLFDLALWFNEEFSASKWT